MNTLKIKKGDHVIVIAGSSEYKGKKAKVVKTNPEKNTLIAEGINMQKHHKKARSAKDTGGIISEAGAIDVSNVMVICPSCDRPTRVGYEFEGEKKVRVCKHSDCKASLDKAVKKTKGKKATEQGKVKKEKKSKEKETN